MEPRLEARLAELESELAEVEERLGSPSTDPSEYSDLGRAHARLKPIIELADQLRAARTDVAEARELAAADPSLADELGRLAEDRSHDVDRILAELTIALTPVDPDDAKSAILEIRAAAGGDEAGIWAGDLLRMYEGYAERSGLSIEPIETSPSEAGGYSKVTVGIKGANAYGGFKFEAGVHRVQRVPRTESQGRVHTSTATVAVLPEVDEVEVEIDPNDVKVDVFRSSGPGGQSVNTTDSAVRLTHLPTGLVVSCQDEKSQLQNKEKAFRVLRARLYQREMDRRHAEVDGARRSMVKSGDRSEKIRTYNYKEGRVTDHRIELTLYKLDAVLEGDLDELIAALRRAEAAEALAG
ncbi:MAG TPA: peptide chain release factor 1 [Acidimicrobiia bacterium]|nr:peptide chain release factor 1 [Acidimicrobiia bacterium]